MNRRPAVKKSERTVQGSSFREHNAILAVTLRRADGDLRLDLDHTTCDWHGNFKTTLHNENPSHRNPRAAFLATHDYVPLKDIDTCDTTNVSAEAMSAGKILPDYDHKRAG